MSGKPKPAEAYRLAFCLYAISKEGKDVRQTPDRDNQGGIIMKKCVSILVGVLAVVAAAAALILALERCKAQGENPADFAD